jgi:hypothetical protein
VASNQARVLARTALVQARLEAARFLTSRAPMAVSFEELGFRLFDAPVPRGLQGAWPRSADDAPARLLGLLSASTLSTSLVDRFDEDWFANPRAVLHLRAIASGPAEEERPADPPDPSLAVGPLVRAFEQACG